MKIFAPHDHSESRLKCQDCNEPICPKCMTQCAVGARCPKCAGKFAVLVGKLLHKISGYKLGARIVTTAAVGLLAGVIFSPVRDTIILYSFTISQTPGAASGSVTSSLVTLLFAIILFIGAAVSPFMKKS